ncbi:hypothetical protein GN244_ATG02146 [Phytophthora infestans]|uniref:Uncharacterized protein n=1 Tax=Phytophthora infestans TaxID=4787 RepID=A0A833T313_PHYIN|nr:hypothetical protein GN244_ATG02146 [Phytophthora infestans]KAF4139271.1 hypothetical protein GN958_ATG11487 [Phytophthora infestans]
MDEKDAFAKGITLKIEDGVVWQMLTPLGQRETSRYHGTERAEILGAAVAVAGQSGCEGWLQCIPMAMIGCWMFWVTCDPKIDGE